MTTPYTFFADLATEAPIPARGILSQTLSSEADIELLLLKDSRPCQNRSPAGRFKTRAGHEPLWPYGPIHLG